MYADEPRRALGIGFEAMDEQAIEAAAVGLDAQREAAGERLLDAGDDLPRSLVAQPRAVGGGEMEIVEALQALVRRRLRLHRDAGPHRRRADAPRDAQPRLPRRLARERIPVEPDARLEARCRSERQPILQPARRPACASSPFHTGPAE